MKKKTIIIICTLALFISACIVLKGVAERNQFFDMNKYRENSNYVARIYYSDMMAMDAGTEYNVFIYKVDANKYAYIKTSNEITIAGAGKARDIKTGIIRSEKGLEKLIREAEKYKTYAAFYLEGDMYVSTAEGAMQKELSDILFS